MLQVFTTKQFKAGNSQAVRIPSSMAFADKTELNVYKKGNKIIIEPKEETLEKIPILLKQWGKNNNCKRLDLAEQIRDW